MTAQWDIFQENPHEMSEIITTLPLICHLGNNKSTDGRKTHTHKTLGFLNRKKILDFLTNWKPQF